MASARVTLAESAVADLQEIRAWYAEQGVPDVAERLIREILDRLEALRDHPMLGREVPEFGVSFLRELIVPPFRAVYRLDSKRIRVVRVWRSERLLQLQDRDSKE